MKKRNEIFLKRGQLQTSFICLIFSLIIFNSYGQAEHSIAVSELEVGDSIYVITNREIDTTQNELTFNHKIDGTSGLKFVKVILNNSLEESSRNFSEVEFMSEISTKASDWLLFVHGDGKTFNESVQRGLDIQNTYNVNVIVFSWPSEVPDINGLKNFKNSESNVSESVEHFCQLLRFMENFKEENESFRKDSHLSVLLHSLGNLYLKKWVDSSRHIEKYDTIFENLVINSAAVNRENHKNWVEELDIQKRIFITNNHYDYSLKGLHLYTRHGNQLGEEFTGSTAENANYIHFTEAVGFQTPTSNTHTYFIGDIPRQSKNIRMFYQDILHGKQVDFSNSSQFVKRKEDAGFDILY